MKKKFIVEQAVDAKGIITISVYKKSFFGKKLIQSATDTRAQYALTKAFKGLLSKK